MDTNVTHEALRAAHALSGGFRPLMEVSKLAAIIDREAHIPDLLAEVERLRGYVRQFVEWWDEWCLAEDPCEVADPPLDEARAALAGTENGQREE